MINSEDTTLTHNKKEFMKGMGIIFYLEVNKIAGKSFAMPK